MRRHGGFPLVRGLVCAALLPVHLLSACASSGAAPNDVFLPRLDHDNEGWPAALIWGTLFEVDGCVFIRAGYEGVEDPDDLLIWASGTTADRTEDGTLRVLVDGTVVGRMGDDVELGGGFVGESRNVVGGAESLIGTNIPERCRTDGGYFLTSGSK